MTNIHLLIFDDCRIEHASFDGKKIAELEYESNGYDPDTGAGEPFTGPYSTVSIEAEDLHLLESEKKIDKIKTIIHDIESYPEEEQIKDNKLLVSLCITLGLIQKVLNETNDSQFPKDLNDV